MMTIYQASIGTPDDLQSDLQRDLLLIINTGDTSPLVITDH